MPLKIHKLSYITACLSVGLHNNHIDNVFLRSVSCLFSSLVPCIILLLLSCEGNIVVTFKYVLLYHYYIMTISLQAQVGSLSRGEVSLPDSLFYCSIYFLFSVTLRLLKSCSYAVRVDSSIFYYLLLTKKKTLLLGNSLSKYVKHVRGSVLL